MWTTPEPVVQLVSELGAVPEVIEVTQVGRGLARMIGLRTPEELVGVVGQIADMMERHPSRYGDRVLEEVLLDYAYLVAGRQMVYLPEEQAFALTTPDRQDGWLDTGKRVRLASIDPDVRVVEASA